jgi:hypothetical protein
MRRLPLRPNGICGKGNVMPAPVAGIHVFAVPAAGTGVNGRMRRP